MKKMLVVDDDMMVRLVVMTSMGTHFPESTFLAASNGKEAMTILRSQHVQGVLTDVFMEEMNGLELVEYINTYHPGTPVAVMSGEADKNTKEKLKALGVTHFLEKPFSLKKLATVISDLHRRGGEGNPDRLGQR